MAGILDYFQNTMQSPLFLGGASLLTGGGMGGAMQGMQAGLQFQDHARRRAIEDEQNNAYKGLLSDPNIPQQILPVLRASQPSDGLKLAAEYLDPSRGLEAEYKRAQIAKLKQEAATGGEAYGKTGAVVQGSDGRFYAVRYSANGTERINPLQIGGENLTPAKGYDIVGDQKMNKASGQFEGNVSSALVGGERAKAEGKAMGEGAAALPKARLALNQYNEQEKTVQDSITKAIGQANGWTTGFMGATTSFLPGSPAHNLSNTLNTIKSNLGFDKLQAMRDSSPTGGALGPVSDMENRLLQSVWGAVEQSQSQAQLVENLQRVAEVRKRFAAMKQQAYEEDVKRFGAANVPNPDGIGTYAPQPQANPYKSRYGLE